MKGAGYGTLLTELSDAHEERELEAALIANVQRFLTEMGPHIMKRINYWRLVPQ